MKAKWQMWIVAGVVLVVLNTDAMAQRRGRGPGRGQGWFQGSGRRGPGPVGQQWGPRDGRGVWGRPGAGQNRPGAWCPWGLDRGVIRGRAGQFNQPWRRPEAGTWSGRVGMQGQGMGGRMGLRGQGWADRGMQNWGRQMGPGRQQPSASPLDGGPAAGGRGQGQRPAQQDSASLLDRLFDRADANNDGTLTREELNTYQDARRGGRQSRQ